MSANNQILIKEHKGKYLVFENVNAERWCSCPDYTTKCTDRCTPTLSSKGGVAFDSASEAQDYADKIDEEEGWPGYEYGVVWDTLFKDDTEVKIID